MKNILKHFSSSQGLPGHLRGSQGRPFKALPERLKLRLQSPLGVLEMSWDPQGSSLFKALLEAPERSWGPLGASKVLQKLLARAVEICRSSQDL